MRPTDPFRAEHQELLTHLEHMATTARQLPRMSDSERTEVIDRVLGFLRDTLIPHAKLEEEILYPEWARLVGFADAAVPMVHDHEAIVARIERLENTDRDDIDALQELLYGLYALIGVHFRKEEDLQLPVFDASPDVAASVFERMAAAPTHKH